MSKYVIEFDKEQLLEYDKDTNTYFRTLYKAKGFNALVFDKNGLDKLTPLDKELEEAYQKGVHDGSLDVKERVEGAYQKGFEAGSHEATTLEYQRGLEDGKKQAKVQAHLDVCHDIERVAHGNYQKGLDDAWETITRIAKMPDGEREKVFGDTRISNILNKYSVSEIITILGKHESQPDEIKVGDEVIYNNTIICAVLTPETDNRYASIVDSCGKHYFADHHELKKTGKHYDHIEQLLAEMRERQKSCSNCKHEFKLRCEWPCEDCLCHDRWEPKEVTE